MLQAFRLYQSSVVLGFYGLRALGCQGLIVFMFHDFVSSFFDFLPFGVVRLQGCRVPWFEDLRFNVFSCFGVLGSQGFIVLWCQGFGVLGLCGFRAPLFYCSFVFQVCGFCRFAVLGCYASIVFCFVLELQGFSAFEFQSSVVLGLWVFKVLGFSCFRALLFQGFSVVFQGLQFLFSDLKVWGFHGVGGYVFYCIRALGLQLFNVLGVGALGVQGFGGPWLFFCLWFLLFSGLRVLALQLFFSFFKVSGFRVPLFQDLCFSGFRVLGLQGLRVLLFCCFLLFQGSMVLLFWDMFVLGLSGFRVLEIYCFTFCFDFGFSGSIVLGLWIFIALGLQGIRLLGFHGFRAGFYCSLALGLWRLRVGFQSFVDFQIFLFGLGLGVLNVLGLCCFRALGLQCLGLYCFRVLRFLLFYQGSVVLFFCSIALVF